MWEVKRGKPPAPKTKILPLDANTKQRPPPPGGRYSPRLQKNNKLLSVYQEGLQHPFFHTAWHLRDQNVFAGLEIRFKIQD